MPSDSPENRDRSLEECLRIVEELSLGVDDPSAVDPRSSECMSLPRLESIGEGLAAATREEQAHVQSCSLCASRWKAFEQPGDLSPSDHFTDGSVASARAKRVLSQRAPLDSTPRDSRGAGLRGVGRSVAAAAAIFLCVATLAYLAAPFASTHNDEKQVAGSKVGNIVVTKASRDQVTVEGQISLDPSSSDECEGVSIRYLPASAVRSGVRVDQFELTAEEDCAVLVFFRTWDEDCGCLRWRVHSWWDNENCHVARKQLSSGESIQLSVDVTDVPPFEQAVMVATAKRSEDLPTGFEGASDVVACLEGPSPDTTPDADVLAMLYDANYCFSASVNICSETFIVD